MNLVITTKVSIEDMINKLQEIKVNTKLNFLKKISIYYDNMSIRMDEDPFARNAQSTIKNLS